MSKATTIKDAIKRWEDKHPDEKIEDAEEVGFQFQWPPIEKMDNSLSSLTKCRKLSLSTNMIEKIAGISGLKNLKILSLSRNYIKSFSGLEGLAETLEELWMSYNLIEKVKGVQVLKKLRVLYLGNNLVKEWGKFQIQHKKIILAIKKINITGFDQINMLSNNSCLVSKNIVHLNID